MHEAATTEEDMPRTAFGAPFQATVACIGVVTRNPAFAGSHVTRAAGRSSTTGPCRKGSHRLHRSEDHPTVGGAWPSRAEAEQPRPSGKRGPRHPALPLPQKPKPGTKIRCDRPGMWIGHSHSTCPASPAASEGISQGSWPSYRERHRAEQGQDRR